MFVDDLLEKHTTGTVTEYRHYIRAGGKPIALYTRDTTGAISIHYLLRDHLGSLAEITTADGNFYVSENFAAFGERRDAADWSGPPAAGDEAMIADTTGRGFTFHSNLEGSGLIHMNGRVADGLTGRFLSADPMVPDPGSTQSFNRYSYVNNNPLTYTDPSGFTPCLGPDAIICIDIFRTVFAFFGHEKKKSPPKGCHLSSGVPCYGKASSSKSSNVVNDILKLPLDRLLDAYLCTRVMRSPLSCLGGGVFGGTGFGGGSGLPGVNWDGITLSIDPSGSQTDQPTRGGRSSTISGHRGGTFYLGFGGSFAGSIFGMEFGGEFSISGGISVGAEGLNLGLIWVTGAPDEDFPIQLNIGGDLAGGLVNGSLQEIEGLGSAINLIVPTPIPKPYGITLSGLNDAQGRDYGIQGGFGVGVPVGWSVTDTTTTTLTTRGAASLLVDWVCSWEGC